MHDDGETTRQSDTGLSHRRSSGDREGPVLELELAVAAGLCALAQEIRAMMGERRVMQEALSSGRSAAD
jgi:hypothetical protein